jgi:tyrosinase
MIVTENTTLTSNRWICNIRTSKYQLNGSFVVYVFLGPFTDDPLGRASDPNLVGTAAIFASTSLQLTTAILINQE